ncbi:response regulator transcription factor [Streptomyces sp. NPDC060194]|uniref:response regulator transcription factor n=1 Tax=Streptomyces sp. NPDC060194 TaxID=3347069 RepID=UPI003665670F
MTTTPPPGRHREPSRTHRVPAAPAPASRTAGTVLVVAGDGAPAELLALALGYEGWDVRTASADGAEVVRAVRRLRPDAVVLDVTLPDVDGMSLLGRLRRERQDVPVLFLTGKGDTGRRIAGLTAGGDDHVAKPFVLEDVAARLRSLVRRSGATAGARSASVLVVGDLVLDEDSREVTRGGTPVRLTATEFELLRYLMRNPKRVLSKAQILDRVWSYDFGGKANVVELYISYLRRKIDAGREPMIHTRRGAGYVLRAAADREPAGVR